MASKNNIQKTFYIPDYFKPQHRELLGNLIIDEIINRTNNRKVDINGSPFKKYSESYMKSEAFKDAGNGKRPDLTLRGEMLSELSIISHKKGSITIGYSTDSDVAGKVEGNQIGSYGREPNPDKARPFIGLPESVLERLIAVVDVDIIDSESKEIDKTTSDIFSRFNIGL